MNMSLRTSVVLCALAGCATSSLAQCTVNTDLVSAYLGMGNPPQNATQPHGDWRFTIGSPEGQAFVGSGPLWASYGAWVTPSEPYLVPLVGPLFSTDPVENQIPYHYQPPTFRGLLVHPGYTADAVVTFTSTGPGILSGVHLDAENLGSISDGVIISVTLQRASGGSVQLVPPTLISIAVGGAAPTHFALTNLNIPLSAGDRVVLRSNRNSTPWEDWLNTNLSLTFTGTPPAIIAQPDPASSGCLGSGSSLSITAAGATAYQWYFGSTPLADDGRITGANSGTLSISPFAASDIGAYSCVVSNCSVTRTAGPFMLNSCIGDYNCDGGVDGTDIGAFFADWESGNASADLNSDGGVDGQDVEVFFGHWEAGC
jgi:hypothetical protein